MGAPPERLGRVHRRVDAEAPGGVVRRRHDTTPVWISADDQRLVDGAEDSRAPRLRRRRHRGRGARGSSPEQSWLLTRACDAGSASSRGRAAGAASGLVRARHGPRGSGTRRVLVFANGRRSLEAVAWETLLRTGRASRRRRHRSGDDDRAAWPTFFDERERRLRSARAARPRRRCRSSGRDAPAQAHGPRPLLLRHRGYYVQSLTGGWGAAWNAKARFPAASTVKLAIAATVLAQHSGIPPPGSHVDALLREMIVPSDDEAANALSSGSVARRAPARTA